MLTPNAPPFTFKILFQFSLGCCANIVHPAKQATVPQDGYSILSVKKTGSVRVSCTPQYLIFNRLGSSTIISRTFFKSSLFTDIFILLVFIGYRLTAYYSELISSKIYRNTVSMSSYFL